MLKFSKESFIPYNKHGYIIANNNIYVLPHKYTHDFYTACIFKNELADYNISLSDVTVDNAPSIISKIIYNLAVIHISTFNVPEKSTPVFSIFISNPNTALVNLLIHLLENVYCIDGSEEVDVNITYNDAYIKTLTKLITVLKSNLK